MIIKADFVFSIYDDSRTKVITNIREIRKIPKNVTFMSDFSDTKLIDMNGNIVYNELGSGSVIGSFSKPKLYVQVPDNFPKHLLGKKKFFIY